MGETCAYCSNILSPMTQSSASPWDKIIYETPNFVITPTKGALIEGWTLIIAKRHLPAMGALGEEELSELNELTARTRNVTRSRYGCVIMFEHGPACEGTEFGCGVDHAHFHVVPLRITLAPLVEKELRSPVKWEAITDIRKLSEIHQRSESYLYILENNEPQGIVARFCDIPSQFMRRVIANYIGMHSLYDYRKYEFPHNAIATFHRLKSAYEEAYLAVAK